MSAPSPRTSAEHRLISRRSLFAAGVGSLSVIALASSPLLGPNRAFAQGASGISFCDVLESDWFFDDVMSVAYAGIMTGYTNPDGSPSGLFGPNDHLRREDLACIIHRLLTADDGEATDDNDAQDTLEPNDTPFADVADEQYYTAAINWCYLNGIMTGYATGDGATSTAFGVGRNITRAEFAVTLHRMYGEVDAEADLAGFSDVSEIPSWALSGVMWCVDQGVVTGNDGRLLPNEEATRAEVAAMLTRFITYVGLPVTEGASAVLGATKLAYGFESDIPYADTITTDMIELGGGFASWTVVSLERESDTLVSLELAGGSPVTEDGGTILFKKGSFENGRASSMAVLSGRAAEPFLVNADASDGQGYVGGAFVIPVNIDVALFSARVSPSDFSCPADSSISIDRVELIDGNRALLTMTVPGTTPEEQFAVLDTALTEGGISVASHATNSDDLLCASHAVAAAAQSLDGDFPYGTSALEYVKATIDASIVALTGVLNSDGGVSCTAQVTLEAIDGGTIDLTTIDSADIEVVNSLRDDAPVIDPGSLSIIDASTFTFTHTVSAARAVSTSPESALTQQAIDQNIASLTSLFAGCRLNLARGIRNAWGIDQPVSNLRLGIRSGNAISMQATDRVTTEKALEATKETLTCIGEFVSAIISISDGKLDGVGDLISGVGSIFGIAASIYGAADHELYTIDEVMEKLMDVDSSIDAVSAQVGSIDRKLEAIESRLEYLVSMDTFTNLCQKVYGAGKDGLMPHVRDCLNSINLHQAPDDLTQDMKYDDLDENTQKQLDEFFDRSTGYTNNRTHDLFMELSGYLIDTPTRANICDSYFDYIASYFNWEPETYEPRRLFISYVMDAFIFAYIADMAETTVAAHRAQVLNDSVALKRQQDRLSAILDRAPKVIEKIVGKIKDGKVTEPSSIWKRLEDYDSNHIVNLVASKDHNLFKVSKDAFFFDCPIPNLDIKTAWDKRQVDSMPTYNYNESVTLTRADLQTMMSNLSKLRSKNILNAGSLYDELRLLGSSPNGDGTRPYGTVSLNLTLPTFKGSSGKRRTRNVNNKDFQVLVSKLTKRKVSDRASVHHERSWTATVLDLKTGTSSDNQIIYKARTSYLVFKGWQITVDEYNYLAFPAAEAAKGR